MTEIRRLERLSHGLDALIRVPGTEIRFGLDALFGFVPVIGDALAKLPAAYIVAKAHQMGAPPRVTGRMIANLALDYAIGVIPLIGDLFDIGFQANIRNVALLRDHLQSTDPAAQETRS